MQRAMLPANIVLLMLLAAGFAAPLASLGGTDSDEVDVEDSSNGRTPLGVHNDPLDDALRIKLGMSEWFEPVQVIVQFHSEIAGDEEKSLLVKHGLLPQATSQIVPSWLAKGLPADIHALASEPAVSWVEYNSPLVYNMNVTKEVIGAVDVWDRSRLDDLGIERGSPITGAGVTVIVLDSGIDATHPDLDWTPQTTTNPRGPAPRDKVILNAKLDQGSGSTTPTLVWQASEVMQNTDTTSGHGTHCAGTVAGNGDASAGDKVGIAPDAWLIGLSMGEAVFTFDEYSALEYAFRLSEPDSVTQNSWNIRVISNSWGPGFPFDSYDSNDLTVQIIEKIVHENNVAVVFANGNNGGDGSDDQSNIFAKVPAAIGVAATQRDGVGMADFSSRGDSADISTWPDVAAPGVDIWSAAARATMIGGAIGAGDTASGDLDYYYLAISGTSMATPHVAGLIALLWQAAPSMHMSEVDEDLMLEGDVTLVDPNGIAPPQTASRPIHEAELILKLTTDYITEGENLPGESVVGVDGRQLDYAQGYGLVNAQRAVAVALALQELRDPDRDGFEDAEVTVFDAFERWEQTLLNGTEDREGEGLRMGWDGEFSVVSAQNDFPPASSQERWIWIPAGTTQVTFDLNYNPADLSNIWCPTSSNLFLVADIDGDGSIDIQGTPDIDEVFDGGTLEGAWWAVEVRGNAVGVCWSAPASTQGPRAAYDVDARVTLKPGDYELDREQARGYDIVGDGSASVSMERGWFVPSGHTEQVESLTGIAGVVKWLQNNWWVPSLIAMVSILLLIGLNSRTRSLASEMFARRRAYKEELAVIEADILEAELL